MADPQRVRAFLDLFGAWDPTLAFVMCGALIPMAIAWAIQRRMARPILVDAFDLPPTPGLAVPLAAGAVILGLGWGISGLCPGPPIPVPALAPTQALVSSATLVPVLFSHTSPTPPHPRDRRSLGRRRGDLRDRLGNQRPLPRSRDRRARARPQPGHRCGRRHGRRHDPAPPHQPLTARHHRRPDMDIKTINSQLGVSPQIEPDEVAAIVAAGYRSIICNRPDGEEAGQPPAARSEEHTSELQSLMR